MQNNGIRSNSNVIFCCANTEIFILNKQKLGKNYTKSVATYPCLNNHMTDYF